MSCTTGQTSAILDCICVNGKPLIDYIDGGDQHLQQLITAIQATITSLQACCTSHSQAIATLQGLITTLQGEITALQSCCTSNTAAIATLQGIITTLQGQITNLQNAITALQAQAHPRLTLTKNQDVTNRVGELTSSRATLDVTGQVLNLPPAIAARIGSSDRNLGIVLTAGALFPQVTGLDLDFDTWSGTAPGTFMDSITVPRTGRYNITATWGTHLGGDQPCATFSVGISIGINGVYTGRFTNPGSPYLAEGAHAFIPAHLLQAGDLLTIGAYTDCTGIIVASAYLALEYIEGT